jgi:hypothetical protein
MPLWTAFAQAMRDNAASTDALFTQRAHAVTSMSAVDNMHSYAQIARAYADNTERLATAFDSLYASLTDTQRQAADTLFREQQYTSTTCVMQTHTPCVAVGGSGTHRLRLDRIRS